MNKKIKIKNIVIVPARIGSKRIKQKNIKKFFGKPIIYWTLRSLKNFKIFDKIYISTDSEKIINIVKKFGFKDFILRNKTLSNDYASTQSVIIDALKKISLKNNYDNIFCVYPCNPFLQKKDLKKAINIISKNKESFILPIVKYSHPIEKAFYYKDSKFISRYIKNSRTTRTQDYKEKFHDTGTFYLAKKKIWEQKQQNKMIGIKTSWLNGIDIDNVEDWNKAELIFKIFKKKFKFHQ